jgi:hypothetical protein
MKTSEIIILTASIFVLGAGVGYFVATIKKESDEK